MVPSLSYPLYVHSRGLPVPVVLWGDYRRTGREFPVLLLFDFALAYDILSMGRGWSKRKGCMLCSAGFSPIKDNPGRRLIHMRAGPEVPSLTVALANRYHPPPNCPSQGTYDDTIETLQRFHLFISVSIIGTSLLWLPTAAIFLYQLHVNFASTSPLSQSAMPFHNSEDELTTPRASTPSGCNSPFLRRQKPISNNISEPKLLSVPPPVFPFFSFKHSSLSHG